MTERKLRTTGWITVAAMVALFCGTIAPAHAEETAAELKSIYGADLKVLGQVQAIDTTRGELLVAGQHISIAKDTSFSYNGLVVEDQAGGLSAIQPGDLIAVFGEVDSPTVSISRLKEAYVPGATTIFVKARVTSSEQAIGRVRVDELSIDLTPAMSDAYFERVEADR